MTKYFNIRVHIIEKERFHGSMRNNILYMNPYDVIMMTERIYGRSDTHA